MANAKTKQRHVNPKDRAEHTSPPPLTRPGSWLSPVQTGVLDWRTTPYFQFDLSKIRENINTLREIVRPDLLFYAVKCNSLPEVLTTIGETGCGFEINNQNEWLILNRLGLARHPIVNSSPISSAQDVGFLFAMGIKRFCFDSAEQIENLRLNAPGAEVYVRLCQSSDGSRFKLDRLGADFDTAVALIALAAKKGLRPVGVTFHVGSQCCDPGNWDTAIKEAAELFRAYPFLQFLNLGGGLPVPYQTPAPDIIALGKTIKAGLDRYFDHRPEIYMEPGRFIVGDAAYTCASVIQVREEKPVSRAVLDMSVFAGFMEILEISDGFHYALRTNAPGREREMIRYDLGGPTCAGTDIICRNIELPRLRVDYQNPRLSSRVYFANTGAYTLDYIARDKDTGFNGARIPKIYFTGERRDEWPGN
ncbi:MAG: hypothetical protein MI802_06530 [Desulfobacterales bacterium]|nr:hypothetical protein [Desulfobacterales bacterium]